jgi:hypothetical protein
LAQADGGVIKQASSLRVLKYPRAWSQRDLRSSDLHSASRGRSADRPVQTRTKHVMGIRSSPARTTGLLLCRESLLLRKYRRVS